MIMKPKLILDDELTESLDSKSAHDLLHYLQKLNQELEATILIVRHDVFTVSHSQRKRWRTIYANSLRRRRIVGGICKSNYSN